MLANQFLPLLTRSVILAVGRFSTCEVEIFADLEQIREAKERFYAPQSD